MSKINLDSLIGDEKVDMNCPGCGHKFKVKFKNISKSGSKVKCPKCRSNITVEQDNKTKRDFRETNKILKKF